jgi:hypothetical protein
MMVFAMLTPEKCKAYALECRALLLMTASPQQKTVLVELSDLWDLTVKYGRIGAEESCRSTRIGRT